MTRLALIMGLNYRGSSAELQGCINDTQNLHELLISKMGYLDEEIRIMTDDSESDLIPNYDNILRQLRQFIDDIKDHNVSQAFLSYSGHGTYLRDRSGEERDGRDEALAPLDYQSKGFIVDDTIKNYLSEIPATCQIFCLFDCCHSGTMCDLEYSYRHQAARKGRGKRRVRKRVRERYRQSYRKRYRAKVKRRGRTRFVWRTKRAYRWKTRTKRVWRTVWKVAPRREDWILEKEKKSAKMACQLCALSGCRDNQTSADAYYQKRKEWAGALTTSFLEIFQNQKATTGITLHDFLMRLNRYMISHRFGQRPTLQVSTRQAKQAQLNQFL